MDPGKDYQRLLKPGVKNRWMLIRCLVLTVNFLRYITLFWLKFKSLYLLEALSEVFINEITDVWDLLQSNPGHYFTSV